LLLGAKRNEFFFAITAGWIERRAAAVFGMRVSGSVSFAGASRMDTGIVSGSWNLIDGVKYKMANIIKCRPTEAAKNRK
jgi:hypothetical protein